MCAFACVADKTVHVTAVCRLCVADKTMHVTAALCSCSLSCSSTLARSPLLRGCCLSVALPWWWLAFLPLLSCQRVRASAYLQATAGKTLTGRFRYPGLQPSCPAKHLFCVATQQGLFSMHKHPHGTVQTATPVTFPQIVLNLLCTKQP